MKTNLWAFLSNFPWFKEANSEEDTNIIFMFEVHFFALFGITSYGDVMASKYLQGWTFYMFKAVFASYLTLSIIVLINLLIAMMSDTYCRIQEQSDIGELKHGFKPWNKITLIKKLKEHIFEFFCRILNIHTYSYVVNHLKHKLK